MTKKAVQPAPFGHVTDATVDIEGLEVCWDHENPSLILTVFASFLRNTLRNSELKAKKTRRRMMKPHGTAGKSIRIRLIRVLRVGLTSLLTVKIWK